MSRLFTFFEILSHNLAFVCAPPPPQSTTGHTPHLFCLHLRVYRPAGAIRRSARLLSATIHRALSPASRKRDTRSMLRLFRCAQYAYAMRYCPCGQYAHLCASIAPLGQYDALRGYCLRQYTALYATAISLRSIRLRHALLPMRAIRAFVHGYFAALNTPCQLRYALNRLFALNPTPYEPYLPSHRPHIFPTYSACAENLPAPRQILKIVEKKRLTYCFLS